MLEPAGFELQQPDELVADVVDHRVGGPRGLRQLGDDQANRQVQQRSCQADAVPVRNGITSAATAKGP